MAKKVKQNKWVNLTPKSKKVKIKKMVKHLSKPKK